MIHKFWNVRLAPAGQPLEKPELDGEATDADREKVRREEDLMEEKVYKIWSILSTFEESSAACISEMLLHVSNGAYVDGVLIAKSFISHVEILFAAIDTLASMLKEQGMKGECSIIISQRSRSPTIANLSFRLVVRARSKTLV